MVHAFGYNGFNIRLYEFVNVLLFLQFYFTSDKLGNQVVWVECVLFQVIIHRKSWGFPDLEFIWNVVVCYYVLPQTLLTFLRMKCWAVVFCIKVIKFSFILSTVYSFHAFISWFITDRIYIILASRESSSLVKQVGFGNNFILSSVHAVICIAVSSSPIFIQVSDVFLLICILL